MAGNRIFARIDGELLKNLEDFTQENHIDKSTVIQMALAQFFSNKNNAIVENVWLGSFQQAFIIYKENDIFVIGANKNVKYIKKCIDDYVNTHKSLYKKFNIIYANISDVYNIEQV